ncbi:MAG: sigma-54-dependent transcriptional regulator [Candidatus Zixiibacteriota bacterium]
MKHKSVTSHADKARILIVDDEESLRNFMEIMLSKEGYAVQVSPSADSALGELKRNDYDLVVTDLMMPDMSGLELLSRVRQKDATQKFIVMTAFGSVESAIEAMKRGAADYITKPFNVDQVKLAISRTLDRQKLENENSALKEELGRALSFDEIIGSSEGMQNARRLGLQISQSDSTALIRGESGVGKDLFARAIHNASPRANGPYVTLNCAALPENLLESELFGHTKGAFTGAVRDKDGLFQAADGGTLFLDEIGDISPAMQVKLLRALEDQYITPVGETKPRKVNVRLIAATNADLESAVKTGAFRHDLYYRLNVIQLDIPSLRERPEDIPILIGVFLERFCESMKKPCNTVSPEGMAILEAFDWPGNVRELENTIERAVLLCKGSEITPEDFPEKMRRPNTSSGLALAAPDTDTRPAMTPTLESIEKAYIHYIMSQTEGNKSRAAKILGIDVSTLYRRIEKYGWNKWSKKASDDESTVGS